MDKWGREEKIYLGFLILLVLFVALFSFSIKAENSESPTEWHMYGRNLNHTSWDGITYTTIPSLINGSVAFIGNITSSPAIANGYVYVQVTNSANSFYQLNASNISQVIATYSAGTSGYTSPSVSGNFVYLGASNYGGGNDNVYQFNASNISQKIANYSAACHSTPSILTIGGNTYLYIGCAIGSIYGIFYQLNASNISQQIANYTLDSCTISAFIQNCFFYSSPAIANGLVYVGSGNGNLYAFNASNVSQVIGMYDGGGSYMFSSHSPAVYNGAVYVTNLGGTFYKLNASTISQVLQNFTTGTTSVGSPVISDGFVYFANTNNLYQLNASNMSQQIATIASTLYPMAYGNFLYAVKYPQTLLQLNLFNISQQFANITVEGTIAQPSAANGYVYFGTDNGKFYQVNASNISLGNSLVCVQSWTCSNWNACSGGTQTRTCTDANNCNILLDRPALSQSCTSGGLPQNTTTPTPPPVTETQNIGTITSGQSSSVSITNPSINIYNITINTNRNISSASITVSKKENENLPQTFPTGVIYQAFSINTTVNNNNLNNVTMEFRVNKSWLDQQNYSYNDVILYRIPEQDSLWQALTTLSIKEDKGYYYFSALSPGFSTFIIFIGMVECSPAETRCFNNELQSCAGNKTWTLKEQCHFGCQNEKCSKVFSNLNINSNIIYTGIVLGVSVAVIIIFYLLIKKASRKKTDKTSKQSLSKFYRNQSLHR